SKEDGRKTRSGGSVAPPNCPRPATRHRLDDNDKSFFCERRWRPKYPALLALRPPHDHLYLLDLTPANANNYHFLLSTCSHQRALHQQQQRQQQQQQHHYHHSSAETSPPPLEMRRHPCVQLLGWGATVLLGGVSPYEKTHLFLDFLLPPIRHYTLSAALNTPTAAAKTTDFDSDKISRALERMGHIGDGRRLDSGRGCEGAQFIDYPPTSRNFYRKFTGSLVSGNLEGALGRYRQLMASPRGRARITHSDLRSLLALVRKKYSADKATPFTIRLMNDMNELGIDLDLQDHHHLLKAYLDSDRKEDAYRILASLRAAGLKPTPTTYNIVLDDAAKRDDLAGVRRGLQVMQREGTSPDVSSYNILLYLVARTAPTETAHRDLMAVMEEMDQAKVKPNLHSFNILTAGLVKAGENQAAMQILGTMTGVGISPDYITYSWIIRGLLHRGDVEGAEEHKAAMLHAGLSPDERLLRQFVFAWAKAGNLQRAALAYEELSSKWNVAKPNVFFAILRVAAAMKDERAVRHWIHEMRRVGANSEDPSALYRAVIGAMLRDGDGNAIEKMHCLLVDELCPVNSDLEQVWRSQFRKPAPPTVAQGPQQTSVLPDSRDQRICLLCKSTTTFPMALELYSSADSKDISLSAHTAVLAAYARIPSLPALRTTWARILSSGHRPSSETYNALLGGLLRAGMPDEAIQTVRHMRSKHVEGTPLTMRYEAEAAAGVGDLDMALEIVRHIMNDRLVDGIPAIETVIKALVKARKIDDAKSCYFAALSLKDLAKGRNTVMRNPVADVLLLGLAERSDLEGLIRVCEELKSQGVTLTANSCGHVVKALLGGGLMDDAERILWDTTLHLISAGEWDRVMALVSGVDGRLGATVLRKGVAETGAVPPVTYFNPVLSTRLGMNDVVGVIHWYEFVSDLGLQIPMECFDTIFQSRHNWPKGFLRRCLSDLTQQSSLNLPIPQRTLSLALDSFLSRSDAIAASQIFSAMKNLSYNITPEQRKNLILVLATHPLPAEAVSAAADPDMAIDPDIHQALGAMYARLGDSAALEQTLTTLTTLTNSSPTFSLLWSCTLSAIQGGHMDLAMMLIYRLLDSGMEIQERAYVTMFALLADRGDVSAVVDLNCRIVASGIVPNPIIPNLILKTHLKAGKIREAVEFFESLRNGKNKGPKLDLWAYNTLIGGIVKLGDMRLVKTVVWMMEKDGCEPDWVTFTSLLKTCDNLESVQRLVQKANEAMNGKGEPDEIWTNALAAAYAELGEPELCEKVLGDMSRWDLAGRNTVLGAWSKIGDYVKCVERYWAFVADSTANGAPFEPDSRTFTILMSAAAKSGQVVDVAAEVGRWREEMRKRGISLSKEGWNTNVHISGQLGGVDGVRHAMQEMKEAGVQCDNVTYASLVKTYGDVGDLHGAQAVVEEMKKMGITPSKPVLLAILDALASNGLPKHMEKWTEEIPGWESDSAIVGKVVKAHLKAGKWKDAVNIVKDFEKRVENDGTTHWGSSSVRMWHLVASHHASVTHDLYECFGTLYRIPADLLDPISLAIGIKAYIMHPDGSYFDQVLALWRWATKGTDILRGPSEDLGDKLVFPGQVIGPSVGAMVIDAVGLAVASRKVRGGTEKVRDVWKEVVEFGVEMRRKEEEAGNGIPYRWRDWPTENMCNSFIEALHRCGYAPGAIKVLKSMSEGAPGYKGAQWSWPRPSPKTIRSTVGPLLASGRVDLVSKVRRIVREAWPELEGVIVDMGVKSVQRTPINIPSHGK
ncbi:hypothetical protein HK104_009100, partial [Borealophlyctis nickersoniae]